MSKEIKKPIFTIKDNGTCAVIIEMPVEICTMDFKEDKLKFHKDYYLTVDSVMSTMAQYDTIKKAYLEKVKQEGEKNGKK